MSDLAHGYPKEARALIDQAVSNGWTAARSRKGHIILRHPSGRTAAVSRNAPRNTRKWQNTIASIRRIDDACVSLNGSEPAPTPEPERPSVFARATVAEPALAPTPPEPSPSPPNEITFILDPGDDEIEVVLEAETITTTQETQVANTKRRSSRAFSAHVRARVDHSNEVREAIVMVVNATEQPLVIEEVRALVNDLLSTKHGLSSYHGHLRKLCDNGTLIRRPETKEERLLRAHSQGTVPLARPSSLWWDASRGEIPARTVGEIVPGLRTFGPQAARHEKVNAPVAHVSEPAPVDDEVVEMAVRVAALATKAPATKAPAETPEIHEEPSTPSHAKYLATLLRKVADELENQHTDSSALREENDALKARIKRMKAAFAEITAD